jgi:non-ribosomal peptide synthetase component F
MPVNGRWHELIHGRQWQGPNTLWVEDGTEYSWAQVDRLGSAIEAAIGAHGPARVVRIASGSKLGCFAGQLAAWRAGCVAVVDDGTLGAGELDRVRPDLSLAVAPERTPAVEVLGRSDERLPLDRIPGAVVAVNFTSGSTGTRKAVGVTRANLLALFGCRDLDVPAAAGLTAGSFASPAFDGWWFDTWRTVSAGGTVVCLPKVNEDVFAWPELALKYRIDRVLLPAAVVATVVDAVPACLADIPWVFSGGEQFQVSTYRQARQAGLRNRFINLYGPTEATFATHGYALPENLAVDTIPIGKPLAGCQQSLREVDEGSAGRYELVVTGPFVCLGYLEEGFLARRFASDSGQARYSTGDLVRVDGGGNLVFAGRRDSQIKVNGVRIDAAAMESEVTRVPGVSGCLVVPSERGTVAFVHTGGPSDSAVRSRIEAVVKEFSTAIAVRLVPRFPVKPGGKIDTAALLDQHYAHNKGGER